MATAFLLGVIAPHFSGASTLRLKSGARDPAAASSVGAANAMLPDLPERAGDAWLVQYDRAADAGFRAAIASTGARVVGYVPENAYLVRGDAGRIAGLAAHPGIRVIAFRPIDRLAPALLGELTRPPDAASPQSHSVTLRVSGFRGEDGEALAARAERTVRGVVAVSVSASATGRATVILDCPRPALARVLVALASDPAVEFVASESAPRPMNTDASWVLQSGVSGSRPLFATAGLTGVGQRVALADMGLDSAACQFNFAAGPGTASNTAQPPQCNVTNAGDKVVSYYLATGADFGDAAATLWHGSGVAAAMVGDNWKAPATIAPRNAPFTFATPDAGDGMAPGAQLVVQDLGTSDGYFVLGLNQDALLTQAYCSGARVHNSSYGLLPMDTGAGMETIYDGSAADIDDALWRLRDLSSVWAAGNWGAVDPATLSPWNGSRSLSGLGAVAKNTITVGASGNPSAVGESIESLIAESARGPSLEGLWKPDVVAPGHNVSAVDDATSANCATQRRTALGTSFAAGAGSGMAALARQYFTDGYYPSGARTRTNPLADPEVFNPSNALVKAVLVNSTRSMSGSNTGDDNSIACPGPDCAAPSFGQGWGRLTLDDALYFSSNGRRLSFIADIWNGSSGSENSGRGDALTPPIGVPRSAIHTHETHNYALQLLSATQGALRCTLAWSDPAASPAASVVLVNDLDLEVHDPGPDGNVGTPDDLYYHGNQFLSSLPYGDSSAAGWDAVNAIENVWIQSPNVGIYNIRVYGRNVPGNGLRDIPAEPPTPTTRIDSWDQGYALICSGDPTDVKSIPLVSARATSPTIGCVEDAFTVDFDATCATCVAWEWDFGDGGSSTLKAPSHLYPVPGLYLVSVTGRDASGVEGRDSLSVEVVVGDKNTAAAVGNTLQLIKLPTPVPFSHAAYWSDIGVPAATTYQMWQFTSKSEVSAFPLSPPVPPTAFRIASNPNPLVHGYKGNGWNPGAGSLYYYQIRAANCEDIPGP